MTWTEVSLKRGDIFTKSGWMNVARPNELLQFQVMRDGFTCKPLYTKEDLAIIKKMNKSKGKL